MSAFFELSTNRQIGMDVGPIPQQAIYDYADRHGLGDLFVMQIMDIDREYMRTRGADKAQSNG